MSTAAEISLRRSIVPTRVRSWNKNVKLRKARSQVQRAHHKYGRYSSQHSAALETLDRTDAFVAETHSMAMIDEIQSQIFERRTAAAWKSTNKFCERKLTPLSCIKASSINQVKEKLRQHYANVLNRPPPPSQINIFRRSSTTKIGVERVNQATKLTRTEVNSIVDVAVNCVQMVVQILRQCPRLALSTPYQDVKVLQH